MPEDEKEKPKETGDDNALDAFRPEAIAERIDRIGDETEADRTAREEEVRLLARKKDQKKKGKQGLEASAAKRLHKIGQKAVKRPGLPALAIDADPILERAAKLRRWMGQNARSVAVIAGVVLLGGGIFGVISYLGQKKEAAASTLLARAVADERGKVGEDKDEDDENRLKDPRPSFKTPEERRDAALAKYAEVVAKYRGTGAAMLARLGQAGVLLDKRDVDAALTAYRDVRSSPLALADGEVRGRALEGIGLVYELKAFLNPSERGAMLDEALKAFRELEKTDVRGFRELGMYHQARVLEAQGDRATALEVLKKVHAEISKQGEATVFPYLDTVVDDRIRALDPSALPAKNPYGKMDMSDPRMRQLLEQLQRGQRGQEQKP